MTLYAACRIATGTPNIAYAYVRDSETGKVVASCHHIHRSRLRTGGKNAEFYAMKCANKMLTEVLKGRKP